MAVPKKRSSRSKSHVRKAAWFAKAGPKADATLHTVNLMRSRYYGRVALRRTKSRNKLQGFGLRPSAKPSEVVQP